MFGAVFVLHILHNGFLLMDSIRTLLLGINVNRIVPLPDLPVILDRVKDTCRNGNQTGGWSDFSVIFG
jgi:hypothetical protein